MFVGVKLTLGCWIFLQVELKRSTDYFRRAQGLSSDSPKTPENIEFYGCWWGDSSSYLFTFCLHCYSHFVCFQSVLILQEDGVILLINCMWMYETRSSTGKNDKYSWNILQLLFRFDSWLFTLYSWSGQVINWWFASLMM